MSAPAAAAAGGEGDPARPARKVYLRHAAQTWARARELYLAGWTAAKVAAELGCSTSAVRLQAARGGWTRRDVAAGKGGGGRDLAAPLSAPLSAPLGEGRFDPPLLACARADGRPEHLRLTREAWELIRGERLAGASIAGLAAKWGVSEGTIRRHAHDEGWSNTDRGEAVSRAKVEAALAERAFAEGRAQAHAEARAEADALAGASPRVGVEADPLETAEVLARRAAALALGGRAAEALALLKVAEGLRRASAAAADAGGADEEEAPAWERSPAEVARSQAQSDYAAMSELERAEMDAGVARMARNFTGQDDPQYPELAERARAAQARVAALRAAALAFAAGDAGALPSEEAEEEAEEGDGAPA